jgi:hypothetical protein
VPVAGFVLNHAFEAVRRHRRGRKRLVEVKGWRWSTVPEACKPYVSIGVEWPLRDLMHSCETCCVALCCGIRAFNFSSGAVERWVTEAKSGRVGQAIEQLNQFIERIAGLGEVTVGIDPLNWAVDSFHAASWLCWLRVLLAQAAASGASRQDSNRRRRRRLER